MPYSVIQPPFTLKFMEMPRKELTAYFKWYTESIPERVRELADAVTSSPGYGSWKPTFTPESLDELGEWLAGQMELRPRSKEEIEEFIRTSPFPIDPPKEDLTNRSFSLAFDTGMYLSQVFLKNHPTLRWKHELASKRHVDFGQPVLISFGPPGFNPTRMMVTHAYGLAEKGRSGKELREIYEIWVKMIGPSPR